jgi:type IV secretory pathway VirD2 relaxase
VWTAGGLDRFFAMPASFSEEERGHRTDVSFSKKSLSATMLKGTVVK